MLDSKKAKKRTDIQTQSEWYFIMIISLYFFLNSRVVCESELLTKFFAGYDKAVRPDFGKLAVSTTEQLKKQLTVQLILRT